MNNVNIASKSVPVLEYRRDFLIQHPEFNIREVVFLNYLANRLLFHKKKGDISVKGYFRTFKLIENDLGFTMSIDTLTKMVKKFVEAKILVKTLDYSKEASYHRMYLKFTTADIINEIKGNPQNSDNLFKIIFHSSIARLYNIPTAVIYSTLQRLSTQERTKELKNEIVEFDGWLTLDKDDLARETGLSKKEVRNAVDKLREAKLIDYIPKPKGNSPGLGNMSKFKVI